MNHLLVAHESTVSPNSFWLIRSCQSFYERAISAPYVPLYVQLNINELSAFFSTHINAQASRKGSSAQLSTPQRMSAEARSFVPSSSGPSASRTSEFVVKEMSPSQLNNNVSDFKHQENLSSRLMSSPPLKPQMMRYDSVNSFHSSA